MKSDTVKSDTFKLEFVSNIKDAYEFEKMIVEAEPKTLVEKPESFFSNSSTYFKTSTRDIFQEDNSHQDISHGLRSDFRSERGAGMVEYALLVTLMSIGCMGAISFMGEQTNNAFLDVANGLACTGYYNSETDVCTP
ncbi:MAG: Flp family type IVb pilin [Planctomycetes bacterium]|nr:Flp family type IVb pilin [Planctomycetota bacterium]